MEGSIVTDGMGIILCIDVPERTHFGIDFHIFQCGPKFKGIRLIPPGIHFVYYNSDAGSDVGPPRTGFFVRLQPNEIQVFIWNPETEQFFKPDEVDADQRERYILGVKNHDFDAFLGPYSTQMQTQWNSISKHITPEVLDLLEPVHKQISSMYDSSDDVELLKKLNLDNKFASPTPYVSSEPFYSHIPKNPPKTATPAEITKMALDKSWILQEIWKRYKGRSHPKWWCSSDCRSLRRSWRSSIRFCMLSHGTDVFWI